MKTILSIYLQFKILTFIICGLIGLTFSSCSKTNNLESNSHLFLSEHILSELEITSAQKTQFSSILKNFKEKENHIQKTIKSHRENLYKEILSEHPDVNVVSDLNRYIADEQYYIECLAAQQLMELKKICNKTQLAQLKQILENRAITDL